MALKGFKNFLRHEKECKKVRKKSGKLFRREKTEVCKRNAAENIWVI